MAQHATHRVFSACIALVAMVALAGAALACGNHKAKTAASAAPTAPKSAAVMPAPGTLISLPGASAPVAKSAFSSLPNFTQPAPAVAGLWAFIDPETGLLSGPIRDLQVPEDLGGVLGSPVELTPVTLPNGAVMIDLKGTLQDYYVLTIDPLGRRSVRCVQDARHAHAPAAPIVLPIAER